MYILRIDFILVLKIYSIKWDINCYKRQQPPGRHFKTTVALFRPAAMGDEQPSPHRAGMLPSSRLLAALLLKSPLGNISFSGPPHVTTKRVAILRPVKPGMNSL
jgi:hypothetical protein